MSEWLYSWLATLGVPVLFATTFASCLALPVPSSLMMLAAGAFAASGDLSLPVVVLAAWLGAVSGDQFGYWLGGRGSDLLARLRPDGRVLQAVDRARELLERRGGPAVFFSRWLVSPLGPYVNFVAGATRLSYLRFAIWGAAGETIWVALYVGLGWIFADRIGAVADLAGNISGLIAGLVVLGLSGAWIWHHQQEGDRAEAESD